MNENESTAVVHDVRQAIEDERNKLRHSTETGVLDTMIIERLKQLLKKLESAEGSKQRD